MSIYTSSSKYDKLTMQRCSHDVELRYPSRPENPAVQNLDLHVPHGKTVAICGSSGSGKSSIIALLMRFFETTHGKITIDGKDIRSMKVERLREMMGFVSQESVLFEGSVRTNLAVSVEVQEKTVTRSDHVPHSSVHWTLSRSLMRI